MSERNSLLSKKNLTLTHDEAKRRFHQVEKINYELFFKFEEDSETFDGKAFITFDLKHDAKRVQDFLRIDFAEGKISSFIINDKEIQPQYDNQKITIPLALLHAGQNLIEIIYQQPFSQDGTGMNRFKDPVDEQTYIYSHFEPYGTHKAFPCFDQPDLKALYTVQVEAPKNWSVITNTLEDQTRIDEDQKIWEFVKAGPFSTYVFALHVGPYQKWSSTYQEMPLNLFARKSLAKHVDFSTLFHTTQKGLQFFEVQFGMNYPFDKYDQILVPDLKAQAMENIGAVTLSENFIFRGKHTQKEIQYRNEVILHEMAHMWFGNLVTMKWWNDLWLNESFASFMASKALKESLSDTSSWNSFFYEMKRWAYRDDQWVTSHAIELPVPDTATAESNFDGITYGKGASVLKQLEFLLGEDEFREGMQRYFEKFAFQNTTLTDFTSKLTEASGRSLQQSWEKNWLKTAGLNSLKTEFQCKFDPKTQKSTIQELSLIQSSPVRLHRTRIALYKKVNDKIVLQNAFDSEYQTEKTTLDQLVGEPCPDFVFANDQDYDYVKLDYDQEHIKIITQHLSHFSDDLTRQMLWHTLWENLVDGKIKASLYLDTVFSQLNSEKNILILDQVLSSLAHPSSLVETALKFSPLSEAKEARNKIENWSRQHFIKSKPHTDEQLIWFRTWSKVAQSNESQQLALQLLDKKRNIPGFIIHQDIRWELIQILGRNGYANVEDRIKNELKKDSNNVGKKATLYAQVTFPNSANQEKWLNRIHSYLDIRQQEDSSNEKQISFADFQVMAEAFSTHESVLSLDDYFTHLKKLISQSSDEMKEYAKFMFPSQCSKNSIEKTKEFIQKNSDMPISISRILRVRVQQEERCTKARSL